MSDQWGPTGAGDEQGGAAQPPPPPPPPTPPWQQPVEPALTLESESEVTKSSGIGGRAVAGLVGVLLLVGGTVFAVSQLGSSGPESPEAAVSELLDAASNEDVLGLLGALDPGERDALREPVESLVDELKRLEVLDESFALDGVGGFDFEFEDVTYRTEPVSNRDDLTRVYFTGGTVTASINSDEVPIGDFVSDTLDRFEQDISGFQESETSDLAEDSDTFLVAKNGSDGWRVSLGYTAAEAARIDAALPMPDNPVEPIGADSPEAAVEGMARAAVDLDLEGMIARLSPGEMGALQDYAGLFLDDAGATLDQVSQDFDITIDDLSLESDRSGDRASVFVTGFAVTVVADGMEVSLTYADECFTIEGDLDQLELEGTPFADGPVCADDFEGLIDDFYGSAGIPEMDIEMPEFPTMEPTEIGITATRVDGKWYVAPIATVLDGTVAGLEVLERSHLDAFVDFFEELQSAFIGSFEESFTEIGDELPEDFYEYDPEEFDPEFDPDFDQDFDQDFDENPDQTATTLFGGTKGSVDEEALRQFVFEVAEDQTHGECILGELDFADEYVRFELADAYTYDYDPSPNTQQVFLDIYEYCSGL